jgi:hypothetical protein
MLLAQAEPGLGSCNVQQAFRREKWRSTKWRSTVKLRFLGKDSTPDESPTLYATDRDSYVVQGWIVTDAAILARLTMPDDETIAEVPAALFDHLALDGLDGEVTNVVPPIVGVTPDGNYIIQGLTSNGRSDRPLS